MVAQVEPGDEETGPTRTCVVTRMKGSPREMIRFVIGPGDVVVPDIRQKLPGRGVWVAANAMRVAEAVKKRAFARGFKRQVTVSEKLAAEVEALLTQDCLQALSIANKAGQVAVGFGRAEEAIVGGVAGLIHAVDGGADGVRKLGQSLRRRFGEAAVSPRIRLFRSGQLDLALGRANVIHAALLPGSASEAVVRRCRRLAMYRSEPFDANAPDHDRGPAADCG